MLGCFESIKEHYNRANKTLLWFGVAVILLIILCILVLFTSAKSYPIGCHISFRGTNQPLVLNEAMDDFIYRYDVGLAVGQSDYVVLACTGSNLPFGVQSVTAQCISSSMFTIVDAAIDINTIECEKPVESIVRPAYSSCANSADSQEVEIGYLLENNKFIRQILICFDKVQETPLYSEYNLTQFIANQDVSVPRPFFVQTDGFFAGFLKLNQSYSRNVQRETINRQLKLPKDSTEFIKKTGDLFLSKGHLTAKMDFVYGFQQNATFYYINAAPQWQTFNGGNWNLIEIKTRDLATDRNLNLQVFTGVYDILTLNSTRIYLYSQDNTQIVPVPKLFWKVIYEPIKKQGVAIIGVNNPYLNDTKDEVICPDVSSSLKWIRLDKEFRNITNGFSYACDVPSFRSKVTYLPQFEVSSLLV